MSFTPIYNHIDAPRRYVGLTLAEIMAVGIIGLIGFVTDKILFGLVGAFFGLYITRYLQELSKTYFVHRFVFFHLSDLGAFRKKKNIFAKFYL